MKWCRKKYKPEFDALSNAVRRCHNSADKQYVDYGGRGIRVCDEWRTNRDAFMDHLGPKPYPDLTLDRIDNNKGYEPGNVRWATRREQQANRRPLSWKITITHNGITDSVKGWGQRLNRSPWNIRRRIKDMPLSEALVPK